MSRTENFHWYSTPEVINTHSRALLIEEIKPDIRFAPEILRGTGSKDL
jgi:hypothetical protein